MQSIDKILFECLDAILNNFRFIDKIGFYCILESQYKVDRHKLSQDFDKFHLALVELYGLKHYQIEKALLKAIDEYRKQGYCKMTDEVTAYTLVNNVVRAEAEVHVKTERERVKNRAKRLGFMD